MKIRLWLSIVVMALMVNFAGCDKADDEAPVDVKSQAEYKVEADKEITEENMEDELGKIEAEIAAEPEN